MSRHTTIAGATLIALGLSALMMSACGAPNSGGSATSTPALMPSPTPTPLLAPLVQPGATARAIIEQHTECRPFGYGAPQWSADNKWIVYMTTEPVYDVRRVHPDGTGDELAVAGVNVPELSPDGKYLLYRPNAQDEPDAVIDLATGQSKAIGRDMGWLTWMPDSQSIAKVDESGEYVRMRIDTLETERVPGSPVAFFPPVWAPDGRVLAYLVMRDGLQRAVILETDSGSETLVALPEGDTCPDAGELLHSWSPDSSMLALVRWCSKDEHVWIAGRDGKRLYDWGALQAQLVGAVTWSPDGKRIAYTLESIGTQVYTANVDGSDSRLLSADALDPDWSPDGKQLAFVGTDAAGYQNVFTINADGSGRRPITQNPGEGRVCLH